jgi:integrase
MGLGSLLNVSLAEARDLAADARKLAASGVDPIRQRSHKRAMAALEAASRMTFSEAAESYIAEHEASWRNAKHRQQWRNSLHTHAFPVLKRTPIADVDITLVCKVLRPIWHTKTTTADRVRSRIEAILNWAKVKGYRTGDNPACWRGNLQHALPAPGKIKKVRHHRALPYNDIPRFMRTLRQRTGMTALALELTILTAVRTGETLGATWSEMDLVNAVWTIPPERMKAGREHRVPLSARALQILNELDQTSGDSDFVFPGANRGRPVSSMALLMLLRRMKADVTTHGFRSTMRQWAAETTDFPREVAEAALAHTIGSAVERAYQRSDLFDRRRTLMDAWCEYCRSQPHPSQQAIKGTRRVAHRVQSRSGKVGNQG